MRNERLVGVVGEASLYLDPVDDLERWLMKVGHDATRSLIEGAVPDAAARPITKLRLTDGNRARAVSNDGARGDAARELVAHVSQISQLMVEPCAEARCAHGREQLEGVLWAERRLGGCARLLRWKRVPIGDKRAQDRAE